MSLMPRPVAFLPSAIELRAELGAWVATEGESRVAVRGVVREDSVRPVATESGSTALLGLLVLGSSTKHTTTTLKNWRPCRTPKSRHSVLSCSPPSILLLSRSSLHSAKPTTATGGHGHLLNRPANSHTNASNSNHTTTTRTRLLPTLPLKRMTFRHRQQCQQRLRLGVMERAVLAHRAVGASRPKLTPVRPLLRPLCRPLPPKF